MRVGNQRFNYLQKVNPSLVHILNKGSFDCNQTRLVLKSIGNYNATDRCDKPPPRTRRPVQQPDSSKENLER